MTSGIIPDVRNGVGIFVPNTSKQKYKSVEIKFFLIQSVVKIIALIIVCGTIILCARILETIADSWAGETTVAKVNIGADVNASLSMNNVGTTKCSSQVPAYSWVPGILGLLFGFMAFGYGKAQSEM